MRLGVMGCITRGAVINSISSQNSPSSPISPTAPSLSYNYFPPGVHSKCAKVHLPHPRSARDGGLLLMTIRARLPRVHVIRGIMHWIDLRLGAMAGKTPGEKSYGIGIAGRGRLGRKPCQLARPSSRGFRFLPQSPPWRLSGSPPGIWTRLPLPQPLLQSHAPAP